MAAAAEEAEAVVVVVCLETESGLLFFLDSDLEDVAEPDDVEDGRVVDGDGVVRFFSE
jgi:hypothetical protein